jgi:hypothetical protein
MPLSYRINQGKRCIFVTLSGEITESEMATARKKLTSYPGFDNSFSRLIRESGVETARVGHDFIRSLAYHDRRTITGRTALVGDSDLMYGVFRVYAAYADGLDCRVFRDRREAMLWLGL